MPRESKNALKLFFLAFWRNMDAKQWVFMCLTTFSFVVELCGVPHCHRIFNVDFVTFYQKK